MLKSRIFWVEMIQSLTVCVLSIVSNVTAVIHYQVLLGALQDLALYPVSIRSMHRFISCSFMHQGMSTLTTNGWLALGQICT